MGHTYATPASSPLLLQARRWHDPEQHAVVGDSMLEVIYTVPNDDDAPLLASPAPAPEWPDGYPDGSSNASDYYDPSLVDCQGDSGTWDAGWGPCSTYAEGQANHDYCTMDAVNRLFAIDVCPQCGGCSTSA